MKAFFVSLLIFLLSFSLPSTTLAFKNEPNDFRGIQFGSELEVTKSEMILQSFSKEPERDQKFYFRKNDSLIIGNSKVKEITYGYYDGVFSIVNINAYGKQNMLGILDSLVKSFGEPTSSKKDQFIVTAYWQGRDVKISYMMIFNSDADLCGGILSFIYLPKVQKYIDLNNKEQQRTMGF